MLHKFLHLLEPEKAHNLAIWCLKNGISPRHKTPQFPTEVMGLKFANPIGMAAGFDKNAEAIEGLFNIGFGFVEVGTVTPRAQDGNPKPRIFRHSKQEAIVNRLGFNNKGIEYFLENIQKAKRKGILGINIGANKDTENFIDDYKTLLPRVNEFADYITANISSPNTPGLRALQKKESIKKLIGEIMSLRQDKPIVVKIAPDLEDQELYDIIDVLTEEGIDGVIATNTTIAHNEEQGGMSGQPLRDKSTEIIRKIHRHVPALPIIGVGGVKDAESANEKFTAGASLAQVYTGLIYEGTGIVREILK